MNYDEFKVKVQDEIRNVVDKEVKIEIRNIIKNNGVLLSGLIISNQNQNMIPTIYLEEYFNNYKKGESIENIVEQIMKVYLEHNRMSTVNMNFFNNYNNIKDHIFMRLINTERNKNLLEEIPNCPYMDLSICFYFEFKSKEIGDGMILIRNEHLLHWNISEEILEENARKNTMKKQPYILTPMKEILAELMEIDSYDIETELEEEIPMYVLTNEKKYQGAACILYPDILENIYDMLNGNYYMIPSSIHEFIIIKENGNENPQVLHEMIKEINESQLLPEEVLSDYPYYYNHLSSQIKRIY